MYAITRNLIRLPLIKPVILGKVSQNYGRQISMKIVPATSIVKTETYQEKNARLGREMSPHLTIYKPQLTSMLSITHRGTGVVLAMGVWALGLAALTSPQDIGNYTSVIEGLHLNAATLGCMKFIIAYPFAYHTANGVRHLLWDTGRFLKIKEVYSTGYAMVGVSIILATLLAML